MFGFKKVNVNEEKAAEFWSFFESRSEYFIDEFKSKIAERQQKVLDEIEIALKELYSDGFKGNVEFQLGGNPNNLPLEFYFYHLNNSFLKSTIARVIEMQPNFLKTKWKLFSEK